MGNVRMEARQINYRGGETPMNVEDAIKNAGSTYELPTASADTLGGVKVGSGLSIEDGVLSANGYTLPAASSDTLGGVKVGTDLHIAESGRLSVLCTIPVIDKYEFSVGSDNSFNIQKTHNKVQSTITYPSGMYETYTVDNLFTVTYDGNWTITLLVASTEYSAGATWTSGYMEQPAISELDFVIGQRTGTASEFFTEIFNALS